MIERNRYRIQFLKAIIPYVDGVKKFFFINFLLGVIILLLGFITPVFYRIFIEDVILQGRIDKVAVVVVGYLAVCSATILLDYIKLYGKNRLVNDTTLKIKYKIWQGLFEKDFSTYEKQDIGNIKMIIEDDIVKGASFASSQTIDYAIAYIKLLGAVFCVFYLDWRLALFSILVIPISFYLDNMISRREKVYIEQRRKIDQDMASWLHASIQGWREVKALNLQRYERRRFIEYISSYAKSYAKWVHYWVVRVHMVPTIRDDLFMQFGLYFLGGLLIIFSDLKISDLLVFTTYYTMLSESVRTVSTADADLQASLPHLDRLVEELKTTEAEIKTGIIPDHSNRIEVSDVSFSYDESSDNVLEHFSLVIEKGERVAITGKSGCGKTTLLKLITGIIVPREGTVSFSGIDLRKIDLKSMHCRMGYVMQENLLFNISIRDNLIYGKSDATEEDMIEACKKASIYDLIESLPERFDTVIGEKGIKLSGGQRQRIILARLFLRDVDIFIFDEATSALDQYSENMIQDAIQNIGKDKTIIVVAHRESSIRLCERRISL